MNATTQSNLRAQKYRPDIDGLRAIAVASVILFHLEYVRGGFVGVDIFFVISGFLITSILVAELECSKFSISGFYERRIRRIAPALIFLFAGTTLLGYKYLFSREFEVYAQSLIAATLSGSNFFFWHQSGYFDALSSSKPLLHTWSLAVEEQYYLFFPLLLAAVYPLRRQYIILVVFTLAALSLIASVVLSRISPTTDFYWPVSRAWELLLGSLLSLVDLRILAPGSLRNLASAVGLLLIVFALFHFTEQTPFPGAAALIPCVGVALIIASNSHGTTLVGRFLSLKPFVFIGLISYSLYLWHWPVIVFSQDGMPLTRGMSRPAGKAVLVLVSLCMAIFSWRFIERPFRRARHGSTRRNVFVTMAAAASVTVTIAGIVIAAHGFPYRFGPRAEYLASFQERTSIQNHQNWRLGSCFISSGYSFEDFKQNLCLKADRNRENYLLIGDSHAAQLYYGLSRAYPEINFMQATASGCRPTLMSDVGAGRECLRLVNFIFHSFLPSHPVDYVLLAARWHPRDVDRLGDSLAYLKRLGVTPIIIGPNMEYDASLPRLLAMSIQSGDTSLPDKHRIESTRRLDARMSERAMNAWHVSEISYYPFLCPDSRCVTTLADGSPLQDDADHLSSPGSEYIAQMWRKARMLPIRNASLSPR